MRLESFRARGFGPFKQEWSVDVSEMRGLIAVTGANGAGKSTFLELGLPGALYRQTPTRGSLVDLATARDACLDVTVVNGQRWQIRHLVDSVSGKSEALVVGADGQPAIPDSKVKSYDAWASTHWPAPEVLLSTIFGAQGSGGFLAAKPAERKSILLRVLGVERLEKLAERAREQLKTARAALDVTAARIADEKLRGGDVATLEELLTVKQECLAGHEEQARRAQQQLDEALEVSAARALIEQRNEALTARKGAISARVSEATAKLSGLEERIANNRAVQADAEQIREAADEVARLERKMASLHADSAMADAEANRLIEPWANIETRKADIQSRVERLRMRLRDAAAIQQAQLALSDLHDAVDQAKRDVTAVTAQLEELQATHLAGSAERLEALRGTLVEISEAENTDDPLGLGLLATEALETDDHTIAVAASLPQQTLEAKQRVAAARERLAVAERQLADASKLAARAGDLEGAETELASAEAELAGIDADRVAAARAAHEQRRKAENLDSQAKSASERLKALAPLAAKAAPLANAEARLAELEPQADALRVELEQLRAELGGIPDAEALPPASDLEALRRDLRAARLQLDDQRHEVAKADQRLIDARASAARLAGLGEFEQAQLTELSDWTRVAADLGKDGLQALEIDAAGPELTALCNDILHRAHGPRFTVRVETQRASADGKRQLEGCDVMVLDTVQGREAAGETFSGGERVVLSEALALAITVLACRRSGLSDVSLVRDESGAALDPGNARVYVAMLRHAIELTGARHCLLVSHMPEVQELCDHRIEVGA